ncbi:adenine deaminase [Rubrobacter calidifluminis]|uniref:adenine deaminase n=1 Tax=Rubrobacter calidifluminis TaxID=1392640 RepID=UPI0023615380|nr:adenine deaminase C-terminal domain-containing protein [Rubrobacter calidifluminis]
MEESGRRRPLYEMTRELAATAMGELPATLVVRGGTLVSVTSGEVVPGMDVAVQGPRIAYVGPDAGHTIGPDTRVIEAEGRYVAPGFLDGHCHIESSQLTVARFAEAVLPLGTTGGFFDAHEISNVLGLEGLRLMLEEARTTPLAAYLEVASCVPSTSTDLETPGAVLGPEEVAEAMGWGEDVIALGEVMNFPGVVFGDEKMHGEIAEALKAGRAADGHFCWPPDDRRLAAYAASGVSGCHEGTTPEDTLWRLRQGMYAKLRRGSAWHDVAATIKAHTEMGLDPRRILLVTDDRSPESILDEGHMDFVVRHAISQGVRPVVAFQMATLNTAERFGVSHDVGSVTPGRRADIILLDGDLADVRICLTVAAGEVVAEDGRMVAEIPRFEYPSFALDSVRVSGPVTEETFAVEAPVESGRVPVRAFRVVENHVETREERVELPVSGGLVRLDPEQDVCRAAVIERHGKGGWKAVGFVCGVGFREPAAIASTVAHDSHNLLVIGSSEEQMARAARAVVGAGGGVAVARGEELVVHPLPVAGLMSPDPFEAVAERSRAVGRALAAAGCTLNYAFMTLSLLALVVLPELHLSDRGLVRVDEGGFRLVPLFTGKEA